MPSREISVLSVSDQMQNQLFEKETIDQFKDINLIISCGDLPYYYIEKLIQTYEVPAIFVRGNHDHALEYRKNGPQSGPFGGIDLHRRLIIQNGIIFLGMEGSLRYREGPFMYTQSEMWRNVFSVVPQLMANKIKYGRYLDVVITHSPPWDIHDQDTHIHRGFKALRWLVQVFKPSYLYHGHIHVYTEDQATETIFHKTKVINTYGQRKSVIRAGKQHYPSHEDIDLSYRYYKNAEEDFKVARRKAALEKFWGTLSGRSKHLINFNQIESQLDYDHIENLGQLEIPLDSIVGTVNRQNDFTRKFFPRSPVDPKRWQRVYHAMDKKNLPIEVYQVGEVYVVLDGNHRVSIARQRGQSHINANVTRIESKVSLTPDDNVWDILIKNQLAQFLNDTELNILRPDLDFIVTTPGLYRQLREQISIHHVQLELEHHYPYTFHEAVLSWVDNVYLPVVQEMTQHGLLRDFPDHTPTDLFLWLVSYQRELSHYFGLDLQSHGVIEELAKTQSKRFVRRWQRFKNRIFPFRSIRTASIGDWRETHLVPRKEGQIFSAILVAINGKETGWLALQQAMEIAERERSTITGLHIVEKDFDPTEAQFRELHLQFRNRSTQENISSNLTIKKGEVGTCLIEHARWSDLLIFSLEHPPEDKPSSRLRSTIRTLIQACPRPILAVSSPSPMRHALLAYDGSPKSIEALFLAAYLVSHWNIQLTVVTALEDSNLTMTPIDQARLYLDSRNITASFISEVGPAADVILKTMAEHECDFLIAGGYGYKPVVEVLLGSTLDTLLRVLRRPILICH